MPTSRKEPKSRTFDLQNDITLKLTYTKPVPASALAGFLANMTNHFKRLRDEQHEEIYKGGECIGYAFNGRKIAANCFLSHNGDETGNYLSTEAWVKAVVAAYTAADTLESIVNEIDAYRSQAGDGWLKEVVTLLDKPGGHLDAFEVVLKRSNTITQ